MESTSRAGIISLVILSAAALLGVIGISLRSVGGNFGEELIFISALLILLGAWISVGAWISYNFFGDYKVAGMTLTGHTEVYIGLIEGGMSNVLISADGAGVSIWKIKQERVLLHAWRWSELPLEGSFVSNGNRSFPGFRFKDHTMKKPLKVIVYPVTGGFFARPVNAEELSRVMERWRLGQYVITARNEFETLRLAG